MCSDNYAWGGAAFRNGGAKYIEYTKEYIETRARMIPLGIVS